MVLKSKMITLSLVLMIFILSGCVSVGVDYSQPNISCPDNWKNAQNGAVSTSADTKILSAWWTTLNDPILSGLIEQAVKNNLEVKKAVARIREARASRGMEEANYYPALDAEGSATRTKRTNSTNADTGTSATQNLFSAGIDAGWELDLFGGVRRSVEAANAALEARNEDLRDIMVSLLGELALNYIDVRTYQARINAAYGNLSLQTESFQLTVWMKEADLSDQLAVEQARYNLESSRSKIPDLKTGLEEAMNRIAVLVGERPGKVHAALIVEKPIPVVPIEVAAGVPVDVIRNRPDIRRAERELAAQTAMIGAAESELYPTFTLGGSIGWEADAVSSSGSGIVLSGGPRISWAIFKAGAIRKNIKVQTALQEQALIKYETAILNALEEVENALKAFSEEQQKRNSLIKTVDAASNAAELAHYKYQAGLADFSSVLDAQRSLMSFQDQLAQSEGAVASNLVILYKALGGGWTSFVPEDEIIKKMEK